MNSSPHFCDVCDTERVLYANWLHAGEALIHDWLQLSAVKSKLLPAQVRTCGLSCHKQELLSMAQKLPALLLAVKPLSPGRSC